MRLSSCNLFISVQILAAILMSKVAAFAEDRDPLSPKGRTKGAQVGDVYEVNISTNDQSEIKPITSEDGKVDTFTLTYDNASYISVHFSQFDLPPGCSLDITDGTGEHPYTLTGQGKFNLGTFWGRHIGGDTMKLILRCNDEEDKKSALFEIDQLAAGFPPHKNHHTHSNERHHHHKSHTKETDFEE